MSFKQTVKLASGAEMPTIGLGTWLSKKGEVKAAVIEAVKVGYRHLDLAAIYGNQEEIGEGLKELFDSGVVKREDLFITSKLWNNCHRPENVPKGLDETLKELGLDYLDLYLIHWPVAFKHRSVSERVPIGPDGKPELDVENVSLVDTWRAMVELQKTGKVKNIGVSNFSVPHVQAIIKATGVKPATNQLEAHPRLPQDELKKWHDEQGIPITAYSPLGNNLAGEARIVDDERVVAVAKRLNADPAQVLIAWGVQRGYSVIPKSVTPSRIKSNFEQIKLSKEDFDEISSMGSSKLRYNIPINYNKPNGWPISVFGEDVEKTAPHKINVGAPFPSIPPPTFLFGGAMGALNY